LDKPGMIIASWDAFKTQMSDVVDRIFSMQRATTCLLDGIYDNNTLVCYVTQDTIFTLDEPFFGQYSALVNRFVIILAHGVNVKCHNRLADSFLQTDIVIFDDAMFFYTQLSIESDARMSKQSIHCFVGARAQCTMVHYLQEMAL